MPSNDPAKYTFLPWLKKGLSGLITRQEGSPTEVGRPQVDFSFDLERLRGANNDSTVNTINKQVSLRGPGDVEGMHNRAILRTEPRAGVDNFEWNYLPYVEFYEEDFPWRYTPATGRPSENSDDNLRLTPWLYLLVLKTSEFELDYSSANKPKLRFLDDIAQQDINAIFAPSSELYAWAHVQYNKEVDQNDDSADLAAAIENDRNAAISRLLSPRKLAENEDYYAFIIPSFKAGWLSGMGEAFLNEDPLTPAWPNEQGDVPREHPFYYSWTFKTAENGDFETLAERIEPRAIDPELGKRDMDLHHTGWGTDTDNLDDKVVGLESALRPPSMVRDDFMAEQYNAAYIHSIQDVLNANDQDENNPTSTYPSALGGSTEDPLVLPPTYGQWHALLKRLDVNVNAAEQPWYDELNLDPRFRAVAGIGSSLVKENQEKFMEEAWEQVDDILAANQRIKQGQLFARVGQRMFEKHIKPSNDNSPAAQDRLLRMTGDVHDRIALEAQDITIEKEFRGSQVPDALRTGTARKMMRPTSKAMQRLSATGSSNNWQTGESIAKGVVMESNTDTGNADATKFFKAHVTPIDAVDIAAVATTANTIETDFGTQGYGTAGDGTYLEDVSYTNQTQNLSNNMQQKTLLNKGVAPQDLILTTIEDKVSPVSAVADRVLSTLEIWNEDTQEFEALNELVPVMAYPEMDFPLYEYLETLSRDHIMPHTDKLPENSVTLLETNPGFLNALFMGINHEMSRELLWREYPTDMRGSYFRKFWDRVDSPDITEINDVAELHTWNATNNLENQPGASTATMVLAIKAELLDKFPDTLIYAQAAQAGPEAGDTIDENPDRRLDDSATPVYPEFRAKVGTDIVILGFPLTEQQVKGTNADGTAYVDYGYYFVLQERPGQIRFGLDDLESLPPEPITIDSWNDLTWQHLQPELPIIDSSQFADDSVNNLNNTSWFKSGSDMPSLLYQSPVLMLIHSIEMINAEN